MKTSSGYRPDIDGLRALAVVTIMIYHFNSSLIPGGFTAIELFFVLSGYLITRNIWQSIEKGTFSLKTFYIRRIRRIAPAYLVATAATLAAGSFLLLPKDMMRLSISAIWASLSVANVYFWGWLDTGYFAASSAEEPLLHTWSLGIEEQFYLIWPASLTAIALLRNRRRWAIAIAGLACTATFICGTVTSTTAPMFSYYMLPSRAAELMLGVLLALIRHRDSRTTAPESAPTTMLQKIGVEILGAAGFGLIAYCMTVYRHTNPYPGVAALLPCVGTLLVMQAGEWRSRIVHSLLATKPVIWVGLISYPLYLWHWPILAYIRYFYGTVSLTHTLIAVPLILLLSVLTYYYVELPIQQARTATPRRTVSWYFGATAALTVVACAAALFSRLEVKAAKAENAIANADTEPPYMFSYNCQYSFFDQNFLSDSRCVISPDEVKAAASEPDILLWGDSNAAHYIGVVATITKSAGVSLRNASHSSCGPLFKAGYGNGIFAESCEKFWPAVQKAVLGGGFKTVIIGGSWDYYHYHYPNFQQDFEQTISDIRSAGARIIILGQTPIFAGFSRECQQRGAILNISDCQERYSYADTGDTEFNKIVANVARKHPDVTYLDVRDFICRDGVCNPYLDGKPLYYDSHHLNMAGSWRLGQAMLGTLKGAHWSEAIAPRTVAANSDLKQGY